MMNDHWKISPGEQVVTAVLLAILVLWTSGVGSEKLSLKNVLLAISIFLLSSLVAMGTAKLFNYIGRKQEEKR
ncbi:hypothetical protein SAMN05421595_1115 [Austwickia chelonae]|uniref:hypothetical protein n=1 Tax=Austwickia chelonae TaxID=100225 RepID=UPI0008B93BC4|nr:hypothetical protein [Austwickia chelonae]SEW07144.1 hypothetical protein SAMN05421595_1115 [Austwickia chelonae]